MNPLLGMPQAPVALQDIFPGNSLSPLMGRGTGVREEVKIKNEEGERWLRAPCLRTINEHREEKEHP